MSSDDTTLAGATANSAFDNIPEQFVPLNQIGIAPENLRASEPPTTRSPSSQRRSSPAASCSPSSCVRRVARRNCRSWPSMAAAAATGSSPFSRRAASPRIILFASRS